MLLVSRTEEFRLFPRSEVTTPVDFVKIDDGSAGDDYPGSALPTYAGDYSSFSRTALRSIAIPLIEASI